MGAPFGRVAREPRRGGGWDLRVGVLMVFPALCLVVVLYEFLYLQQFAGDAQAPLAPVARLRSDPVDARDAQADARTDAERYAEAEPEEAEATEAPAPTTAVRGRRTMIMIANYRDSARCSETLRSIFETAAEPDRVRVSLYDQIYEAEGERPCVDVFCDLVGEGECRRAQMVSSKIDAANATVRAAHALST